MKWKQFSEQLPAEFYDSVQRSFDDYLLEKRVKDLENELAAANQRIKDLEDLVDGVVYYDGVNLLEVNGMAWFDVRNKLMEENDKKLNKIKI